MYNPLEEDRKTLMKLVVEQIIEDAEKGEFANIQDLLWHVPEQSQLGFLNDEREDQYAQATSLS